MKITQLAFIFALCFGASQACFAEAQSTSIFSSIGLGSTHSKAPLFDQGDAAPEPILLHIGHVDTDAMPGVSCEMNLAVTATYEMTGLTLECMGTKTPKRFFSVDELRAGVVLFHNDSPEADAVILNAPGLDASKGGSIDIDFLFNGITGERKHFYGSIESMGSGWTLYTSSDTGHQAFNYLFLAKKTLFGTTIGIKEIQVKWVK